jgi:hypothetical protein
VDFHTLRGRHREFPLRSSMCHLQVGGRVCYVLLFVVARRRLDRYEELRRQFEDWRDVRVVLDRREGERRTPRDTFSGAASRATPPSQWRALLEARLVCGRYARTRLLNSVNLLTDLKGFIHDHRPHGLLTGDATEPVWNGYLLTVACPCGVVFERWVTPLDAALDLLHSASLN